LHCIAIYCSVLQCVAVCCSVVSAMDLQKRLTSLGCKVQLHCVAVCCCVCSVLQRVTSYCSVCSVLQCAAMCCSMPQCVAVCYSVLQCVSVRIFKRVSRPLGVQALKAVKRALPSVKRALSLIKTALYCICVYYLYSIYILSDLLCVKRDSLSIFFRHIFYHEPYVI